MTKHKWHKEIKAWADGAEIEQREKFDGDWYWEKFDGEWVDDEEWTYRIKPQPKEPQYLYVYVDTRYGNVGFSTVWEEDSAMPLIGKIKLEVDDD